MDTKTPYHKPLKSLGLRASRRQYPRQVTGLTESRQLRSSIRMKLQDKPPFQRHIPRQSGSIIRKNDILISQTRRGELVADGQDGLVEQRVPPRTEKETRATLQKYKGKELQKNPQPPEPPLESDDRPHDDWYRSTPAGNSQGKSRSGPRHPSRLSSYPPHIQRLAREEAKRKFVINGIPMNQDPVEYHEKLAEKYLREAEEEARQKQHLKMSNMSTASVEAQWIDDISMQKDTPQDKSMGKIQGTRTDGRIIGQLTEATRQQMKRIEIRQSRLAAQQKNLRMTTKEVSDESITLPGLNESFSLDSFDFDDFLRVADDAFPSPPSNTIQPQSDRTKSADTSNVHIKSSHKRSPGNGSIKAKPQERLTANRGAITKPAPARRLSKGRFDRTISADHTGSSKERQRMQCLLALGGDASIIEKAARKKF